MQQELYPAKRAAVKPTSRVERLADFFRGRPHEWIDARALMGIAGCCAWRTRAAELRKPPFNMRIENRLRHVRTASGTVTISEYRYEPPTDSSNRSRSGAVRDLFGERSAASA